MKILVLDTETTGLEGAPDDLVLDIGISEVDLDTGSVEPFYSSLIGYPEEDIEKRKDSWIFRNSDIEPSMLMNAPGFYDVWDELCRKLRDRKVTSYNTAFDFGKFLFNTPWSMRGWFDLLPDPMLVATDVCAIPSPYYPDEYKWPRLEEAYGILCPEDPAGIKGEQAHRALSDSMVAGHVLLKLFEMGAYRINGCEVTI